MAKTKILVEDVDHDFEITQEDLFEYAQQIGIDVNNEKHLLWIAEEGLSASVPEPWLIISDEKDRIFYYNKKTGEKSWFHPLDKEYSELVIEERSKSKSLNSASSDCGFESKLSSLADAPPLSSSGKNTPASSVPGQNDNAHSSKKLDTGRFENRRGTQLAPVRLNTLKMPVPSSSPKSGISMSFMPKGSSLSKNVRRTKDETGYKEDQFLEHKDHIVLSNEDVNESLHSDDGSKYSYEETDEEGKGMHDMDPYDLLDTSQLSPMHSADESPDAIDINSLVQMGTKLPSKLDVTVKKGYFKNAKIKEISPSLSLRKVGQPSMLKPLQQGLKKKTPVKNSKKQTNSKKRNTSVNKHDMYENEREFEEKISALNEEQRLLLESIQREWVAMQEELEKDEKEKYEQMVNESSKKFEEEVSRLREENSTKITNLKSELLKKVEEEENAGEKNFEAVKKSNQAKLDEEEKKFKQELEALKESLKKEFERIKEINDKEIDEKRKEFNEEMKKEIEKIQLSHDSSLKKLEETHKEEIDSLEKDHRHKMDAIQNAYKEEEDKANSKIKEGVLDDLKSKKDTLEKTIIEEEERYKKLLSEIENLKKEINIGKETLVKIKEEITASQLSFEEIQDEVERTENDLDLLRTEKSALISELSILKDNINNEKSNLINLEPKQEKCAIKKASDAVVNTDVMYLNTLCSATQTDMDCKDAFCQINIMKIYGFDSSCQTSEVMPSVATKFCQVDLVPYIDNKAPTSKNVDSTNNNSNVANSVDKNLESTIHTKMDERFKMIEEQLRLLQDKVVMANNNESAFSNLLGSLNPIFTQEQPVPNTSNINSQSNHAMNNTLSFDSVVQTIPVPAHKKCKCESGDAASCDVMKDVKNSVYRLNEILSQRYVPSLTSNMMYEFSTPVARYTSPFEKFYVQFRDLQERQRFTDLKHKCENALGKQARDISNMTGSTLTRNFPENEFIRSSRSNLNSYNLSEEPLARARSIVLQEQTRSWKQQQYVNSQDLTPHNFISGTHVPSNDFHSESHSVSTLRGMPPLQPSFLNFEPDPETDYNSWMMRLNALQQKIRSHKLL